MDFMDSLNTKVEDIKRPPLLPVGTYRAVVTKTPEITKSEDGRYTFVDFTLRIVAAEEDVSASELEEFGPLTNIVRRHRFMFHNEEQLFFKRTEYNMKRFMIEHLQIPYSSDTTTKELLGAAVNYQCLVSIGRRADKNDKEVIYEDIKGTAPIF